MIGSLVIVKVDSKSGELVARDARAAAAFPAAVINGLQGYVGSGASMIAAWLQSGAGGLTLQHGMDGLGGSIQGVMIDESIPMAMLGVPSDAPAAPYAYKQEVGGPIYPKDAKALAIPLTEQARNVSGPRDPSMGDLVLVKRPGKPPLLCQMIGDKKLQPQFVLVASVTLRATHWFSQGVEQFRSDMLATFNAVMTAWAKTFGAN